MGLGGEQELIVTAHGNRLTHRLHYAVEPLFFRVRDWLSPPDRKLSEVGIRPGWAVLDFGCGIGSYALAAARLVGEGGKVYAVDLNPSRIERVRTQAARHGLDNLQTIVTDCDTMLESETVDAVLLYDVFHCLGEPRQVLVELARILKPGGILSFSDHHVHEAQVMATLTAQARLAFISKGRRTYTFARKETLR